MGALSPCRSERAFTIPVAYTSMLNPLGALSLSTGILSAAVAKGGGATGASFCAASDLGRSAITDWVVGAGSGAGAAAGAFVGGELAPCWAMRGQDVAATTVTRAPATSRCRRTAHEWVMSSSLNDDVALTWEAATPRLERRCVIVGQFTARTQSNSLGPASLRAEILVAARIDRVGSRGHIRR